MLDRCLKGTLRRAGEGDDLNTGAVRSPDVLGEVFVAEVDVLGLEEVFLGTR